MNRLLLVIIVLGFALPASAANLWLADLDAANPDALAGFVAANGTALQPSDVASVGVYTSFTVADVDLAWAEIYFDNLVFDEGDDDGNPLNYEVADLIYHGYDLNGPGQPGWNFVDRSGMPAFPFSPEFYTGQYGYDPAISLPPGAPFTSPNTPGLIDELVIHMLDVDSIDYLYFENPVTTPINTRVPVLQDSAGNPFVYAVQNEFPGSIVMLNAWADNAANFDVPFVIEGVPEPANALLLGMGVLLLRRRRTSG